LLIIHAIIAAVLIAFTRFMSKRIGVNRFSLHGVYRNRLVRAFLGGARRSRAANPFTGFDPRDNVRVHELKSVVSDKTQQQVLYPVVNVTLNLVGGENLAWQERKASAFVISPIACGSGTLGDKVDSNGGSTRWAGAYASSLFYGGSEPDL